MASEGHIIQDERINNPWLGEEESGVGGGGGMGEWEGIVLCGVRVSPLGILCRLVNNNGPAARRAINTSSVLLSLSASEICLC